MTTSGGSNDAHVAGSNDATLAGFEALLASRATTRYELTLFVSGASELSVRAIANARHLCDVHLDGRYDLVVADVNADPAAAVRAGLMATPTLVRMDPPPIRRVVGDLSRIDRVLRALDLDPAVHPASPG